jgi:small GTP-binding protein
MLGDCAVGKTMLSWSSTQPAEERAKDLPAKPTTICAGFVELYSTLPDNRIARTVVWDTAGQERYAEMTRTYMDRADALILVFDVTKTSSFDSITSRWLDVIEERRRINDQLVVVLVANKIDLEQTRCVNSRAARECADSLGFEHYLETSVLLRSTVHDMFNYTIAAICVAQKEADEQEKDHSSTVRLNAAPSNSKSSCCS